MKTSQLLAHGGPALVILPLQSTPAVIAALAEFDTNR